MSHKTKKKKKKNPHSNHTSNPQQRSACGKFAKQNRTGGRAFAKSTAKEIARESAFERKPANLLLAHDAE